MAKLIYLSYPMDGYDTQHNENWRNTIVPWLESKNFAVFDPYRRYQQNWDQIRKVTGDYFASVNKELDAERIRTFKFPENIILPADNPMFLDEPYYTVVNCAYWVLRSSLVIADITLPGMGGRNTEMFWAYLWDIPIIGYQSHVKESKFSDYYSTRKVTTIEQIKETVLELL